MQPINEKKLAEKVMSLGFVTQAQLEEAFRVIDESATHQSLHEVLLAKGFLSEQQLRTLIQDPRGKTSATIMAVGAPPPAPDALPVPVAAVAKTWSFGRYRILEELGHGGMGIVYRAEDTELGRTVAIKMLLHEEEGSSDATERFLREARAAANLNHPNIVHIHDIGVCDRRHYFTMDYVDGSSFDSMLDPIRLPTATAMLGTQPMIGDQGPPPAPVPEPRPWQRVSHEEREKVVRRGVESLAQIARALHQAHSQGIIHRDLKPENILFTSDGVPKLTDFGLAKEYGKAGSQKMTVTGTVMGTPWYMSPEQAAGEIDRLAPASDIFALGVILYELITGTRPFNEETVPGTLHAVMEMDPIPPRRLAPGLHKDLQTICMKALAKEPSRRYATALDFAQDLERYLSGEPISARPTSLTYLVWKKATKHRTVARILAASLGVLLAGVFLAAWGYHKYRSAPQETEEDRRQRAALVELQARRARAQKFCADGKAKLEEVVDPLSKRQFEEADRSLEEGFKLLGNAIETDPEYAEAYIARARGRRLQGRPEPALADVEKALSIVADLPEALYLRAVLRIERYSGGILGDPSDAAIVEEATARVEKQKALDDLHSLAKTEYRGLPAWAADHCRGATALLEERYALAVDDLQKAVQENGALWDVFFQRGLAQEKLKDWEGAKKSYSECLRRNPRHAAAWINRGRLLTHTDTEQAVRDFTEGIRLDPNNSRAYFNRSHAYWHLSGRTNESVEDSDKAIEIDPSFAAAYNQRGQSLAFLQKYDEAVRDYTLAIDHQKDVPDYYQNRASAEMANCHNGALHAQAQADCEMVLKLAPNAAGSYYLHGNYWLHIKDWEKALADFTEALTRQPNYPEAHVNKGNAYLALSKYDEAIAECTAALDLNPKSSDPVAKAYFNRALARYNKKDFEHAKTDFEMVMRANPSGELADQVRGMLEKIQAEIK